MSGAATATTALQDTLAEAHAALATAVGAYGILSKPWDADDIIETMQASARLHLAAMDIADAAKALAIAARDALQAAFSETGCPAVNITGFRVSAQDGHRTVRVIDRQAVPHNYTIQPPTPPREPDIPLIRALLVAGEEVAGCELVTGKPSIRFTKRST